MKKPSARSSDRCVRCLAVRSSMRYHLNQFIFHFTATGHDHHDIEQVSLHPTNRNALDGYVHSSALESALTHLFEAHILLIAKNLERLLLKITCCAIYAIDRNVWAQLCIEGAQSIHVTYESLYHILLLSYETHDKLEVASAAMQLHRNISCIQLPIG
jgi:hypothetical protein